jgi:peroxiredoxin
MAELGQLERRHEDFDRENARVIAVSVEGQDDATETNKQFPHLLVLSDRERGLSNAVKVIHENSKPGGGDTAAPTTILVDGHGKVRWLYRPGSVITRLSPDEVIEAIKKNMAAKQ